jgi:Tfp pilus assembly protein PilE
MSRKKGVTFIEILLALTVIAVFFGLIFAFYKNAINKSKYVEAVATVSNITKAEEMYKMDTGEYVAAANTQEVNERLGMNIEPRWFNYKVVGVTNDNFIVLAERIRDDIESGNLEGDDVVIAMDNSGPISPSNINQDEPALGDTSGGEGGPPPGSNSPGGDNPVPEARGGGSPGSDSGGTPSGGDSGQSSPTGGSGEPEYDNAIDDILAVLGSNDISSDLYDFLQDNDIDVQFADLSGLDALGLWVPTWWFDVYPESGGGLNGLSANTIYLDNSYIQDYSPEVAAAVLCHESLHAYWNYNNDALADYEVDYYNNNIGDLYDPPRVIDEGDLNWAVYREGPLAGQDYIDPSGDPQLFDSIIQEYSLL